MSDDLDFEPKVIEAPLVNAQQQTMPVVTIFGAGVSGLTAAHELIERGFAVQVVEPVLDPDEEHACLVGGLAANQHAHIPAPVRRAHPYLFNQEEEAEDATEVVDPIYDAILTHDRKVIIWVEGDKGQSAQDEFVLKIDNYTSAPIKTIHRTSKQIARKIFDVATNWGFEVEFIGAHKTKLSIDYPDTLAHRVPAVAILNKDESTTKRVFYESPLRLELMRTLRLHEAPSRIPTPERIQMDPGATESDWPQIADDHGAKNHDKITVVLHRLRHAFRVFEADQAKREEAADSIIESSAKEHKNRTGSHNGFAAPQPLSERGTLREGLVVELRGHCHALGMSDKERLEESEKWAGWVRKTLITRNTSSTAGDPIPNLADRLIVVPVRDLEPIAKSRRKAGRRANDRVEFRIVEALVPGEHGYRFFPRFYRHLFDTMKRTPILDEEGQTTGATAFDRLVPTRVVDVALKDGGPVHEVPVDRPSSLEALRELLEINLKARKKALDDAYEKANEGKKRPEKDGGLGLTTTDLLRFQLAIVKFLTSSRKRREAEYEGISWFRFLLGEWKKKSKDPAPYSDAMIDMILETPQALVAMNAEESDARSQGVIYCQLLLDSLTSGDESNMTLNGPTSAVWLCDWKRYLERQGVRFFSGKVVKLVWAKKHTHPSAGGGAAVEAAPEAFAAASTVGLGGSLNDEPPEPEPQPEPNPNTSGYSPYELIPVVGTVSQTRTNVALGVLFADGNRYVLAIDGEGLSIDEQSSLTDATNAVEASIREHLDEKAVGYEVEKTTIRRPDFGEQEGGEPLSLGVLRIHQRGALLALNAQFAVAQEADEGSTEAPETAPVEGGSRPSSEDDDAEPPTNSLSVNVSGLLFVARGQASFAALFDDLIAKIGHPSSPFRVRGYPRGENLMSVDTVPGLEVMQIVDDGLGEYEVWVRDVPLGPDSTEVSDVHVKIPPESRDESDRRSEEAIRSDTLARLANALAKALSAKFTQRDLDYSVGRYADGGVTIDFRGSRKRVDATAVEVGVQISIANDSEPYLNQIMMPPMTIEARSSNLSVLAPEPEVAGDRFLERSILESGVIDPLGPNGPDFYLMATPFEEASRLVWQAYEDSPIAFPKHRLDGCLGEFQKFEKKTARRKANGDVEEFKRDAAGRPPEKYPLRDLSGIQYYFKNEVRIGHGHTYYPDAPWGLSSISQLAHWQERVSRRDGFLGQLSVDIGDFYEGYNTRDDGRVPSAWRSTKQEIADRTWDQIKAGVEDIRGKKIVPPTYFHLDEGIEFESEGLFHSGSGLVFRVDGTTVTPTSALLNGKILSKPTKDPVSDTVDDLVQEVTTKPEEFPFLAKKLEGDHLYVAPVATAPQPKEEDQNKTRRIRVKIESAPIVKESDLTYHLRINDVDIELDYTPTESDPKPAKARRRACRKVRDALIKKINAKVPGVAADPKGDIAIRLRSYERLHVCAMDSSTSGCPAIVLASPRLLEADQLRNLHVVSGQTPTRNRTPFLINNPGVWRHRPGSMSFDDINEKVKGTGKAGHHGETLAKEGERRGIMYEPTQMRWLMVGNQMATYTRMSTMESANESARHAVTSILHAIVRPGRHKRHHLDYNGQGLLLGEMPRIWDPEDHELDDTAPLRRLDEKLMESFQYKKGEKCPPHLFDILRLEEMIDQIPDLEAKPADAAALQRLFTEAGGQMVRDWNFTEADEIQRAIQAVIASFVGITVPGKSSEGA